LLAELGYKQADIDAKLKEAFDGIFYGPDKVYFEVGDDMAYISDVKNKDVRTEGMSYGMMIAVQFDKKDIFDRLWRWCQKYMQHQSGPLEGYFAWSCKVDGTRNSQGPASDGELYYVTSLIFASNRWGNDTGINYLAEAQRILNCSMQKIGMDNVSPFINIDKKLITFTPDPHGGSYTDPSYHLPAFYEVWAKWANDGRSNFWKECAKVSREYLHKSINPETGLNPDYNNYDGSLRGSRGIIGDAFRFDSWRVPMNIALDYSWSCADREWQQNYANTIQNFLYSQGIDTFVDQYNVDGTKPARILGAGGYTALRHSLGLVATSAAVSLAATNDKIGEFVNQLWNAKHVPYEDGYFDAYYDGLLRLFALMHLSGNYRIITPQQ
jgi:endo-1,4-beta-D-glucanase Y